MTENHFELTELKKGDLVTMERVGMHLSLLNSWDVDAVFSLSLLLSNLLLPPWQHCSLKPPISTCQKVCLLQLLPVILALAKDSDLLSLWF